MHTTVQISRFNASKCPADRSSASARARACTHRAAKLGPSVCSKCYALREPLCSLQADFASCLHVHFSHCLLRAAQSSVRAACRRPLALLISACDCVRVTSQLTHHALPDQKDRIPIETQFCLFLRPLDYLDQNRIHSLDRTYAIAR